MRSMTGHGRGESKFQGSKITVELQSVNRKQSDLAVALPREFAALEPQVRAAAGREIVRGRLNITVTLQRGAASTPTLGLNLSLARQYHRAMLALQKSLSAPGEITIETVLRAPGVLQLGETVADPESAWPALERALLAALGDLVKMRAREGHHLAVDLKKRLRALQKNVSAIRQLHPAVVPKYRAALLARLARAGLPLPLDDDRLLKEIALFADRCDVSEELTRLESHLAQFTTHLTGTDAVGRTLDFLAQELAREWNTLGVKANDAAIAQLVLTAKAETERIREQVQNIE